MLTNCTRFLNKNNYFSKFLISSISFTIFHKFCYSKSTKLSCSVRNKEAFHSIESNKAEYFETVNPEEIMSRYPNLTIINSRPIEMLMGVIRDKNLGTADFRFYSRRILRLIIEEALAMDCDKGIIKESPIGLYKTIHNSRKMSDYVAVSILRSGNSMVDEILDIIPEIGIGQILVQRDETTVEKKPIFFYEKLPNDMKDKRIFLLDPMLATGGSSAACIEILLEKGVKEENIFFLSLISCEVAYKYLYERFPKMKMITAKCDPILLPIKYIAPGLGDFGDRYYGTTN